MMVTVGDGQLSYVGNVILCLTGFLPITNVSDTETISWKKVLRSIAKQVLM